MKKIIAAFVKYPFYGKVVIAILLIGGGFSLMSIKKATFPIVESKVITVTVVYQGATPKEMEEGVTTLIEDAIRGVPGIKEFSSKSQENVSVVTITGLSNYDVNELFTDVRNVVDGISNFPSGAEKPIISKQRTTDMAMFMSLSVPDNDLLKLNSLANRVEDDFFNSGKISQIRIFGIPSKLELSVDIDEAQLRRYNLTFDNIQSAISSNNLDIHGGVIKNSREEIKVMCRNRSVDPEDIKKIVVTSGSDGNVITVGDVCNVTLRFEETPNSSYVDGGRNAVFMITKLASEDLQQISDFIHDYVEKFNESHKDAKIIILHDFLEIIDGQLSILISNGIMGILLVIIVLSLMLNFRLSLWVAWGIPASFLGMFILAIMMGFTINLITLFGMILIVGILVDDGIVIGENIFTHYEMGKTPRRAAIEGTIEVLPAVLASVSTTIVAFLPLFFIEGNLKMMYEMAFVIVASLSISLAEGMFVLPGHLANPKVLKPLNERSFYGKIRKAADFVILGFRDKVYLPLLDKVLKFRILTLSIITSLFILTYGLIVGGVIPFTFFPQVVSDIFTIDLALKPGTNESVTFNKLTYIESVIWDVNKELQKEYGDTISYIRNTQINTGSAFNGSESGTSAGMIRVFLNPLEDTRMSDEIIKKAIAKKLGKMPEAYKLGVGASNRFGAPVSISLMGYDLEQLDAAKTEFINELSKMSSLYNIVDNSQLGSQEIHISLKPEAYSLGLNYALLMQQVRQAYYGGLAQRIQHGKDEIWLYVRYPLSNRETIGQFEKMMIKTQKGQFPLSQVADLKVERSLNTINRYNGKREIRVDAYQRNQQESALDILSYIETNILPGILERHPGINYQKQGQQKDSDEQMGSIIKYFGIAFIIIVLIIMIYFKSFSQGMIILLTIPLGFLGAFWGHGIHGNPFSMMSLWGLVALSGTIINDAIVFMSKYNQNLVKGMTIVEAVKNAGKSRFRPIFLTTVTTTVGLMPLIIEKSQDAQMIIPMATSIAYGILFGTFFILISVPVLIVVFNSLKYHWKRLFIKEDISRESIEVAVKNHNIDMALSKAMKKKF